jgi:putative Holliday junction resolvase
MPRYLGIDYGDQRTGFAISDEEGVFAFPKIVLTGEWETMREGVKKIIEENTVSTIVVGLPQNFNGEDTRQTQKVRHFVDLLQEEFDIPIVFQNEILTSKQIDKSGGSTKAMQDASAAALILQQFLDKNRQYS